MQGCCKASFRVYPASQAKTDGNAPYIGTILKKPKSMLDEAFTNADSFDISFPKSAQTDEKGLLVGSALFFNANFFGG